MAIGPGSDRGGTRRSLAAGISSLVAPRASLTTALTGTNNDLTYTATRPGVEGNAFRVRYVVAGTNTALSVSRSGGDLTVNVATDGAGAVTSTAAAIATAVNASDEARFLVTAANATGNNGTGIVTALAFTSLTGGAQPVHGTGVSSFGRVAARGTTANG